tara:strand:- start:279 stop:446 length:168 start_codon:yes stop_codon:yes gene_type:complete
MTDAGLVAFGMVLATAAFAVVLSFLPPPVIEVQIATPITCELRAPDHPMMELVDK